MIVTWYALWEEAKTTYNSLINNHPHGNTNAAIIDILKQRPDPDEVEKVEANLRKDDAKQAISRLYAFMLSRGFKTNTGPATNDPAYARALEKEIDSYGASGTQAKELADAMQEVIGIAETDGHIARGENHETDDIVAALVELLPEAALQESGLKNGHVGPS